MERRTFLRSAAYSTGSLALAGTHLAAAALPTNLSPILAKLPSPVLFRGNRTTAYRDPTAIYHNGIFHLFFTYVETKPDGIAYLTIASTQSTDLRHWTPLRILTPLDKHLEYSSPGDIVRFDNKWVMCLQTYPRPNGQRYADANARIFTRRSTDLIHWAQPELLRVKGPDVPEATMGRMIDPYLLQDKDDPKKWWCFFKQHGTSMSWSTDLETWTFARSVEAGENPCVLIDRNEYLLFHSPPNGIGIKRSPDLITWRDDGLLTLGQSTWPWAQGRLTAGFVLDLRHDPRIGKALMFFHGSQYPEDDPRGGFDNFASLGIAWSDDLKTWSWPNA